MEIYNQMKLNIYTCRLASYLLYIDTIALYNTGTLPDKLQCIWYLLSEYTNTKPNWNNIQEYCYKKVTYK